MRTLPEKYYPVLRRLLGIAILLPPLVALPNNAFQTKTDSAPGVEIAKKKKKDSKKKSKSKKHKYAVDPGSDEDSE
jgi:hypothetical protein